MAGFIERIQAKIELFRLEQRYTRRRNRRSTFVSNAVYVDGEYIYQTPISTGSSTNTSSTSASTAASTNSNKLRNRMSMPVFGTPPVKSNNRAFDWRTEHAINENR